MVIYRYPVLITFSISEIYILKVYWKHELPNILILLKIKALLQLRSFISFSHLVGGTYLQILNIIKSMTVQILFLVVKRYKFSIPINCYNYPIACRIIAFTLFRINPLKKSLEHFHHKFRCPIEEAVLFLLWRFVKIVVHVVYFSLSSLPV